MEPKFRLVSEYRVQKALEYFFSLFLSSIIKPLAYYHTGNLLDKQCGAFFEASCRCSNAADPGARGLGCDGLDSNCDGDPDDCEEDYVPPDIDLSRAIVACTGKVFSSTEEALACVRNTVVAIDDCNGVAALEVDIADDGSIKVTAQDGCGRTREEILPGGGMAGGIQIDADESPPVVACYVGEEGGSELILNATGAGILYDVNLMFSSNDAGGLASLQVDVFANELETENAQVMAYFAKVSNTGDDRLYVATTICATATNGQCIKDKASPDDRVYTIVVSATDASGQGNSAECTITIVEEEQVLIEAATNGTSVGIVGNETTGTRRLAKDIFEKPVYQRFLLTSLTN